MSTRIRLKSGYKAEYTENGWVSDTIGVGEMLNSYMLTAFPQGISGSDPHPLKTIAQAIVDHFGGKILEIDSQSDPEENENTVY